MDRNNEIELYAKEELLLGLVPEKVPLATMSSFMDACVFSATKNIYRIATLNTEREDNRNAIGAYGMLVKAMGAIDKKVMFLKERENTELPEDLSQLFEADKDG